MRWTGHVVGTAEIRNLHMIVVIKWEEKMLFGRTVLGDCVQVDG
jgi:hypothetical protein